MGLTVERDEKMMRQAWMAYDTNGHVMGAGVIGIGERWEPSQTGAKPIIARLKAGVDAYDTLLSAAQRT